MSKFMVLFRQATKLDKEKIKLEIRVSDMEKEASHKAGEKVKLDDGVKELKNFVEELKADIIKKETSLNHFQKKNDEFTSSISKAKNKAIREFMTCSEFTELLDKNYIASFEDFCLDATEAFLGLHFNSIKLPIVAESSLLQTSSKDSNIEENASTPLPMKDDSKSGDVAPSGLSK